MREAGTQQKRQETTDASFAAAGSSGEGKNGSEARSPLMDVSGPKIDRPKEQQQIEQDKRQAKNAELNGCKTDTPSAKPIEKDKPPPEIKCDGDGTKGGGGGAEIDLSKESFSPSLRDGVSKGHDRTEQEKHKTKSTELNECKAIGPTIKKERGTPGVAPGTGSDDDGSNKKGVGGGEPLSVPAGPSREDHLKENRPKEVPPK